MRERVQLYGSVKVVIMSALRSGGCQIESHHGQWMGHTKD